jgi:hypothetical protein
MHAIALANVRKTNSRVCLSGVRNEFVEAAFVQLFDPASVCEVSESVLYLSFVKIRVLAEIERVNASPWVVGCLSFFEEGENFFFAVVWLVVLVDHSGTVFDS